MDFHVLLVHLGLILSVSKTLTFAFIDQDERKCKYTRIDRMVKIRCFDMNLKEVPQYLKTSVEVLDLSYNRIRKLRRNSFERYNSIKYLLLYENMIQTVEPGTFEHLTDLQEIDLSNNGLTTIPSEILQLPSLRNLYVDNNEMINLERDLKQISKPIRAPLEYLNVAECGLQNLPDLGVLPRLWHINASSNPLTEISLDRFANLCHLKSIDLTRTLLDSCACQQINNHLRYLAVKTKFVPICIETLSIDICPLPFNQTIDSPVFKSCKTTVTYAEARSRWMLAAGCCTAVLIVILIVWCCIHKRRKSHNNKRNHSTLRNSRVISPKNVINNHKDYTKAEIEDHDFGHDLDNNHMSYHKNNALLSCDTA